MKSAKEKATRPNQSTEKALTILEYLAEEQEPCRLGDIAAGVGLNQSTALRFLATLLNCGYVAQDADTLKYRLTLKICALANRAAGSTKLRSIARPALVAISRHFGESVSLAVEQEGKILYVDVEEGPDQMLKTTSRIGHVAPLHCTGIGKLHLLNRDEEELDRLILFEGLKAYTKYTITTKKALKEELARIRKQGYALDNEECELGARCAAVPIFDYTGRIIAGISVTGPALRLPDGLLREKLPFLLAAAASLSKTLGYEESPAH